jgi:hypothetical protein
LRFPVEQFRSYRVTLTPPVLNNAACVTFLVSGEEKAATLRAVLEGDYQPDRFPSQAIRPTQGRLLWLVDRAAGLLRSLSSAAPCCNIAAASHIAPMLCGTFLLTRHLRPPIVALTRRD